MNNIMIPTREENGRILISGRDLRDALGIRTKYSTWIDRMITEFDFIEEMDFLPILGKTPNPEGGRPSTDHLLTIEMAKEICMVTRNGHGKQVRKYFIELEKKWNTPDQILSRALKMVDSYINMIETRPTLETATNDELIQELHKRIS